jgi:type I restriction enzyme S subunit
MTTALQEIDLAVPRRKWPRYPSYKPSGVPWLGSLPAHWKIDRLRWSIESARNGVWGSEPDGNEDIPCVRVADFDRVAFRVGDDIPTLRSVTASERRGRVLNKGDLLLEKSGGGELQPVGAIAIFDSTLPAICSNFLARLVPASNCDSRYLSYLHSHLYSARVNIRSIKQTTGIQNLDAYSYFCERVPFPQLDEQRAIAAFLDCETAKIDELIERKNKLCSLLDEHFASLVCHVTTVGLQSNSRFQTSRLPWLGSNPHHWRVVALSWVSRISNGSTPSQAKPEYWEEGDVPWVSSAEVNQLRINTPTALITQLALRECSLRIVSRGAVLIGMVGQGKTRGMTSILDIDACINQNVAAIEPSACLDSEFLQFALMQAYEPIRQYGRGGRQEALNCRLVGAIRIALPPLHEQLEIAQYLRAERDQMLRLKAKLDSHTRILREYRSALITAAVTGQIDIRKHQKEALCP